MITRRVSVSYPDVLAVRPVKFSMEAGTIDEIFLLLGVWDRSKYCTVVKDALWAMQCRCLFGLSRLFGLRPSSVARIKGDYMHNIWGKRQVLPVDSFEFGITTYKRSDTGELDPRITCSVNILRLKGHLSSG